MKKKTIILLAIVSVVLIGCKETEMKQVISSRTTVYSFSLKSRFDSDVKKCYFTIDTINHLIYNEDSLNYGTRVDSLTPYMSQRFAKVIFADSISLYQRDSVYVDFTNTQKMTVTSTTGDTVSYFITVNVHTVPQDSFVWKQVCDFGLGIYERQKAVITDDDMLYRLTVSNGEIGLMSSADGLNWTDESVEGLPRTVDIEHLIANGDELNILDGDVLYAYSDGVWQGIVTSSEVDVMHLLFVFNGDVYALGDDNVILKLAGDEWQMAAQMQSGFPAEGECAFVGESLTGQPVAYIACGIDDKGNCLPDVWSSENGTHWVKLNIKETVCTPRANAAVVQYGKGLLMMGGTARGSLVKDNFLFSKDYGMTWQNGKDVYALDTNVVKMCCAREGLSLVKNSEGILFVVGGRFNRDAGGKLVEKLNLGDVWRGVHYKSIPGF